MKSFRQKENVAFVSVFILPVYISLDRSIGRLFMLFIDIKNIYFIYILYNILYIKIISI